MHPTAAIDRAELDRIVQDYLDGRATDEESDFLEANHPLWVDSLWRLLERADDVLERARQTVRGSERASVLNDLEGECDRIDDLITDLVGTSVTSASSSPDVLVVGKPQLQLSWNPGEIIAWSGGHEATPGDLDALKQLLEHHHAGTISWMAHDPVDIAGRSEAPALAAPIAGALGWIIGLGNTALDDDTLGTSARWFGLAAAFAVELVAQGRMVPQLEQFRGGRRPNKGGLSTYHVRWAASVMDRDHFDALANAAPGASMAVSDRKDRKEFAGAVVADLTDAITRIAAARQQERCRRVDPGSPRRLRVPGASWDRKRHRAAHGPLVPVGDRGGQPAPARQTAPT